MRSTAFRNTSAGASSTSSSHVLVELVAPRPAVRSSRGPSKTRTARRSASRVIWASLHRLMSCSDSTIGRLGLDAAFRDVQRRSAGTVGGDDPGRGTQRRPGPAHDRVTWMRMSGGAFDALQQPCLEVAGLAAWDVLRFVPSFGQQRTIRSDQVPLLADDQFDKTLKLLLVWFLATCAVSFEVVFAASHGLPDRARVAYQRYGDGDQPRC